MSLKQEIKELFINWASSSSNVGITNIFRNRNIIIRFIWLIFTILSTIYCFYSIKQSIMKYYDYDVVSHIENVYKNPIEFPMITICHANPFVTYESFDYISKLIRDSNLYEIENSPVKDLPDYDKFKESANMYFARALAVRKAMQLNDTTKQKFGYDKDFFFFLCFFRDSPCNKSELKWYYDYKFGNCYQFNSGYDSNEQKIPIKKTFRTGRMDGLILMLFVGLKNDDRALAFDNGAHIFITNSSTSPRSTDGIDLAPGQMTNVLISNKMNKQLPKPYNDCYDDLDSPDKFDSYFYRKTLESNYTYRQKDCLDLCAQDYLIKKCKCADAVYPTINDTSYCNTLKETMCLYFGLQEIFNTDKNLEFFGHCPLECSTQAFAFTISHSNFPVHHYSSELKNNSYIKKRFEYLKMPLSHENIKSSFVYANIFYDETKYTRIIQTPAQTFYGLMADIGGTFGLYIGISFLSAVEFVEIAFKILILIFKHFRK